MANNDEHEMLSAGEMQKKYGLYAENREVIKLDPSKVPEAFWHLIPLAERWGEGDDIIRDDMIEKASEEERQALKRAISEYDNLLDEWLAGPESLGPKYSEEYFAFSNMRMAAYEI